MAAQHQEPQPHEADEDAADEADDGNVEADTHEDDVGAAGESDADVAGEAGACSMSDVAGEAAEGREVE